MIGIITAEKQEVANLIKVLKAKIIEFNGIRYFVANYHNQQIIINFCGIGKVNAAIAAMNMITNFHVNTILNIGVCGSAKKSLAPGATLIADKIEYADVDLTPLNYPLNKLPDEPLTFTVKNEMLKYLKNILPDATIGTICSSDSFITLQNIESFPSVVNPEVVGFDMEAAAIAHTCYKTKVNFICVKYVSDNLTFNEESKAQYNANMKSLAKKIEETCLKVFSTFNL